jgi:hypothetical protein
MSESAASDPRDRDDELLARLEGRDQQAAPAADPGNSELQRLLDQATGGAYPRWKNSPESFKDDDRCVVYGSDREDRRCYRDAAWHVWIGCGSEHIARSGVCEFHAIELATAKFGWRCNLCYEATGQVVLAYFIRKEPIAHPDVGCS